MLLNLIWGQVQQNSIFGQLNLQLMQMPLKKANGKLKNGMVNKQQESGQNNIDVQDQNLDTYRFKQSNDREYHSLLKSSGGVNQKKNVFFHENSRYSGTKELNQSSNQQQNEQSEQQNNISIALKKIKQHKKQKSMLLQEDLRRIEEEDEQFQNLRKKQKSSQQSYKQSICLKSQLGLYRELVGLRYAKQNQIESIKRFPKQNFPCHRQLNALNQDLEHKIIHNLNQLLTTYNKYCKSAFGINTENQSLIPAQDNKESDKRLNIQAFYTQFVNDQKEKVQQAEKELIRWSQKTSLLSKSGSHYNSLIMQTPIGQTKKVVSNWERACSKSRAKRNTFKILFQNEENIHVNNDPQIYDDHDLFNELQKTYMSTIEEEGDFRVSDTLKYLKNREMKQKKDVDRKASKNRKIRFNVHPKLLNFMANRQSNEIEARDSIVQNLFNCGQKQNQIRQEGQTLYIDM